MKSEISRNQRTQSLEFTTRITDAELAEIYDARAIGHMLRAELATRLTDVIMDKLKPTIDKLLGEIECP